MEDRNSEVQNPVLLSLPLEPALILARAMVALSDESKDALLRHVGLLASQLDQLSDEISAASRTGEPLVNLSLPRAEAMAIAKVIPATFLLLEEREAETLAGSTRSERAAVQGLVVAALEEAG